MLKKSALFILSLLYPKLVYALDSPFGSPGDFGDFLGTVGKVLNSLITNQYSSFFILAIILFILLYNIFSAPLQKIKVFEGTPGKSIAVALTLLAELGIFYKTREMGIDGLLSGIFGLNNLFVGIVIAILLFLFWRKVLSSGKEHHRNKFALFLTGISCFALDSLLQTPMMSIIGFSLIIISGILFFFGNTFGIGHTHPRSGKGFYKRFKEEWKKTKELEKEGKAKAKDITNDETKEKNKTKEEIKHEKKELDIYEELVKTIEEQIKSKNPGSYKTEVQSLLNSLHNSLEESTHLYTEENILVADEIRKLADEQSIERKIITHEELLKELSSIEPSLKEKVEEEEEISKKIFHLQKVVEKGNTYQKKLLGGLGFINKELQRRLYSLSTLQVDREFKTAYNEVKKISGLFLKRERILKKKKHLLDKERKLTRLIKHLRKKEKKDTKKVGKSMKKGEKYIWNEETNNFKNV